MATYYARNVAGNWASNTSWDTVSSGGAGPAGPPVAGDTAVFDSGFTGSITVAAAAACAVITCQAGAAGTLTVNSGFTLTVSGSQTYVATMALAGTGTIRSTAVSTLDFAGLTFPGTFVFAGSATYTLANNISVGIISFGSSGIVLSGAYNITADYWNCTAASSTFTLVAGQTYTASVGINFAIAGFSSSTFKSSVASTAAYFNFAGSAANCKIAGMIFTDIDASGSAQALDNWYGGTLTRCTNITNRTSADFATAAQAAKILDDTTISGITGTIATRTLSAANETVQAGYYAATTLSAVDADLAEGFLSVCLAVPLLYLGTD